MLTQSEENYLKTIYRLETVLLNTVSTTLIAEKMETKASSVTDMLKKLADKQLINYEKYKGVTLTPEGKSTAVKVVRKHRLWEVFLVNKLGYNWDEVHELAEQLEHIKSDTLIDKLEIFLDFPTHDPHGDPIPTKEGTVNHHENKMLSSMEIDNHCTIIGIKDSSTAFLRFIDQLNIKLGSRIKVISKEIFDNSMLIENNNDVFSISSQISKNLFVKKDN